MSKEQAFREQVYRRCCMCKETRRVATDFTPTNRRCTTCGPIYYAKLRERRLAGEPPRRRNPPVRQQVKFYHSPEFKQEFAWFFKLSSVGHTAGGNAPATP